MTATGTTTPSASPTVIASDRPSFDVLAAAASAANHRSDEFETRLRSRERALLPRQFENARAWARAKTGARAAFDVIPKTVTVGQLLRLNANADSGCSAPNYRTGRVVAITNRAIVVADTGNPSGGYTDAEYTSFGTVFDTLIDPLDRLNFGDPSDIDGNGRMVLFFTKTVNDLTPKNSGSYIGGFFFARDLFPVTTTTDLSGCATSNFGEMFYVMVPDPVRAGPFSKANVATEVYATLAHEYQHLINASRRLYVNTAATDFEETWLDEGLAHIAEELLFYRVSGLQPRQNVSATDIQRSNALVNAFNDYASDNFGRYESYLRSPSAYSPYADNDSLATRGATWAFLRYAADRRGTSDGDVWQKLVNSTTSGMQNLQNVFGSGVTGEIRDWGASVLADDIGGAGAAYQQPSWNYRSVYTALLSSSVFPLANVSLASTASTVSLVPGANAYLRFGVTAGGAPAVQWTGASSSVQFTLVRTK
ncbi:MAG TPA: hypothetical protein VK636_20855 [Gemmatimonadaceae bacterium]|nr:hypothetical protein [Gemmatimonadaceae bacterium]